jgi:hypothetical protein
LSSDAAIPPKTNKRTKRKQKRSGKAKGKAKVLPPPDEPFRGRRRGKRSQSCSSSTPPPAYGKQGQQRLVEAQQELQELNVRLEIEELRELSRRGLPKLRASSVVNGAEAKLRAVVDKNDLDDRKLHLEDMELSSKVEVEMLSTHKRRSSHVSDWNKALTDHQNVPYRSWQGVHYFRTDPNVGFWSAAYRDSVIDRPDFGTWFCQARYLKSVFAGLRSLMNERKVEEPVFVGEDSFNFEVEEGRMDIIPPDLFEEVEGDVRVAMPDRAIRRRRNLDNRHSEIVRLTFEGCVNYRSYGERFIGLLSCEEGRFCYKAKRIEYLPGNHDIRDVSEKKVELIRDVDGYPLPIDIWRVVMLWLTKDSYGFVTRKFSYVTASKMMFDHVRATCCQSTGETIIRSKCHRFSGYNVDPAVKAELISGTALLLRSVLKCMGESEKELLRSIPASVPFGAGPSI